MAESSRHPRGSQTEGRTEGLTEALALARDALAEAPAGLLTDFDGTLSPIVTDPASARLVPGAAAALSDLASRLAVVAIVTGRAPLDARRMTDVPGLLVAGNHGTEWLEPGSSTPEPSAEAERVRALIAGALERVPELPGVAIEDKGLSATVHYRSAPDPAAAERQVRAALGDPGPGAGDGPRDGLELRPGRMSIELRPVGLGDKGAATRAIVKRFGLRGAVVMGDDVTDLDMFGAVTDARAAGRLRGVVIGVGGADGEVPPAVADAADIVLETPEEAARFLGELAAQIGG